MSDRVHTCPVCGGCGTVPHDFYNRHGMSTSTARESCRSCLGRGIIVTDSFGRVTYPTTPASVTRG